MASNISSYGRVWNVFDLLVYHLQDDFGCCICYVQDILFGYVRAHIKSFVLAHYGTDELMSDIEALKLQVCLENTAGPHIQC